MKMVNIITAVVFMVILSITVSVQGQSKGMRLSKVKPQSEIQPLPSVETDPKDDQEFQYEKRTQGEIDGDEKMDREFDQDIGSTDNRPTRVPTQQEAKRTYDSQITRVKGQNQMERSKGNTQLQSESLENVRLTPNPVFRFYSLQAWLQPSSKCCPRVWNYQCRSSNTRLPCFSQYYNNVREWCCPIWPSVFIKRCLCGQCAVLTPTCAHEGQCRRRYSMRSFLAVCFRNHQWGYLRYITKYLPSSCYCRI